MRQAVAFAIGLGCHLLGIPMPAPHALMGSLLVVTITAGYLVADRWLNGRAGP